MGSRVHLFYTLGFRDLEATLKPPIQHHYIDNFKAAHVEAAKASPSIGKTVEGRNDLWVGSHFPDSNFNVVTSPNAE